MSTGTRRSFLKVAMAGAAAATLPDALLGDGEDSLLGRLAHAGGGKTDWKIVGKQFKVEIQGMYGAVSGVTAVDPGRVTVATALVTQGDKPDYRSFTYGAHSYAPMTLRFQTGPENGKIQQWVAAVAKSGGASNALRRDISVRLVARDKSTVLRAINLFGCLPTSASQFTSTSGTLVCAVARIEEPYPSSGAGAVTTRCAEKSLKVTINGEVVPVRKWSGGVKTVATPPQLPSLSPLRLVTCMTAQERVLPEGANNVANKGLNERFTITIRQLGKSGTVSKTLVYDNCLFTSLDYPTLSAKSRAIPQRIVTFQPEILSVS